jgi:hypothetical protein
MSREGYAAGGLASRLVRKLLKRHKKDPEVQSDIITIKSKIDDIDNELGGIGSENVELEKEIIRDLEIDKRYLIEALEEIDVTGRPLDFDETGYPVLDTSGGLDFYGDLDLREPKQEGGMIDEQMGELMPEEAPIPLETIEEPTETMLPDEEMEEDYVEFIMAEALEPEEQQYLSDKLVEDDQLSIIFDKVIETASEFSGSGSVEGPGSTVSDSIPARLSDGEFVMTAKATDALGADTLEELMALAEQEADAGRQTKAIGGEIENRIDTAPAITEEDPLKQKQKEWMGLADPRRSLFSS